jgi:hypothetical protein
MVMSLFSSGGPLRIAFAFCLATLGAVIFAARTVGAEPPPPDLMAKLAAASAGFDSVRKRATFAIDTRIETLDGDGHVTGVETISEHVVREGVTTHVVVVNATKDGKDWTGQARRAEAEKQAANAKDEKKGRLDIPFLVSEQSQYVFDVVETDPNNPAHLRIAFTPRDPDSHSVEGSAWVDRNAGQFLSAGLKVSKPGMFVDYLHATLEIGATTELGPALSRIAFDAKGGFLFIHKHIRGSVVFSDYKVTPQ